MNNAKKQNSLLPKFDAPTYIAESLLNIDAIVEAIRFDNDQYEKEYKAYCKNNAAKRYKKFKSDLKNQPISKAKFQSTIDDYECLFVEGKQKKLGKLDQHTIYTVFYQLELLISQFALCAALFERFSAEGNQAQAQAILIKAVQTYGSIERVRLETFNTSLRVLQGKMEVSTDRFLKQRAEKARLASNNGKKKGFYGAAKKQIVIEKYLQYPDLQKNKSSRHVAQLLCKREKEISYQPSTVERLISSYRKLNV